MYVTHFKLSTAFPFIGGPGEVEQDNTLSLETKNKAFRRHRAANSRVGDGIAADWESLSELKSNSSLN